MDSRGRAAFGLLIAAQAAHSVEEYVYRLFDVFGPARYLAGLISDDLATGFAIGNAGLVSFGLWCYLARVRPGHPAGRGYAWFWALLEFANGFGHTAIAAPRGGYFPGVGTAPLLVGVSLYLGTRLTRETR